MPTPIDEALDAVREALLARRAGAARHVGAIKAAAEAYLAAVEHEIATGFAEQAGVPMPGMVPTPSRTEAVLALRAAVEALPELAGIRVEASFPDATEGPLESVEALARPPAPPPSSPPAPPGPQSGFRDRPPQPPPPTDPEILTLQREVEAAGLEDLPDQLFLAYAEEFAARVRVLQERELGEGDAEGVSRIIRRLTALAHQFNLLRPVFGLNRRHTVPDWSAQARKARQERDRILSGGRNPEGLTQRLPISEALKGKVAQKEEDDEDDEPEPKPKVEALDLPNLRAAAATREVLLVGGLAKNEKLDRLRERTGINIQWVGLKKGSSSSTVQSLSGRIRNKQFSGIVLLQDLMSHKEYEPLIAAARHVGLPVAYGGKAGAAAIERALAELEAKVQGQARGG